jgi:hypothetical protein
MTFFILTLSVFVLIIVSFGVTLHRSIVRSIDIARVGGCLTVIKTGLPQYVYISDSVRLLHRIPAHLILQLILHEDDRYFTHRGFNVPEIIRSFRIMFRTRRFKGGSSVTQQLARTLFCAEPGRARGILRRKLKESIVTVYLERYLSKSEILALYFDHIAFWSGTRGIREASLMLFHKAPETLTIPEGEILISLITGAYGRQEFSHSPWRNQVFDLHLSYEKLLVLQRWFVSTFPNREFSILSTLPLHHEELYGALREKPLLNVELSADKEFQFQLNNALALEAVQKLLPRLSPPIELNHRYLPPSLSVIATLVAASHGGRLSDFHRYMLSNLEERDFSEIESLIKQHVVAGLLSEVPEISTFPPGFRQRVHELRAAELAQHLRVKSAFVALQKLLHSKVDIINVKGIDLHERFYEDSQVRSATDVDILVADEAYGVLAQCLREAGYQKQVKSSDERDRLIARWTAESIVWLDPKLRVQIDIHILRAAYYAELQKNSECIHMREPYAHITYRGLSRISLIKYLCQHAAKHGWSRIQWLADIERVIRTIPKDELSSIVSKKKQSQTDVNTLLGLFLVKHIFLRPHGVVFSVASPYTLTICTLAHIVITQTMISRRNSFVGWTKIRYLWLSSRGLFVKCKCILSYLFTPTLQDLPHHNKELLLHRILVASLLRPIRGTIRFFSRQAAI